MKNQKLGLLLLEIFGVVLFLLFLSPIFLLVINSAKSSAEILASPLSWPASFGQLWTNAVTIWNNPSIKYPSSFFASTIITVISLVTITLFSALAAWGLVRYRSKLSTVVFFIFVAVTQLQIHYLDSAYYVLILVSSLLTLDLGCLYLYSCSTASLKVFHLKSKKLLN